jgi:hypothetical protein
MKETAEEKRSVGFYPCLRRERQDGKIDVALARIVLVQNSF